MRVLAVLAALVGAAQADTCQMECQTRASKLMEASCSVWRDELPRPALYVACKDAFETAYHTSCEQLCTDEPNYSTIIAKKFDICDAWKSSGQQSYVQACLSGYGGGFNAAKSVLEDSQAASTASPAPTKKETEAPTKSESSSSGSATVKKINVKLQDKARDEAASAFASGSHADL